MFLVPQKSFSGWKRAARWPSEKLNYWWYDVRVRVDVHTWVFGWERERERERVRKGEMGKRERVSDVVQNHFFNEKWIRPTNCKKKKYRLILFIVVPLFSLTFSIASSTFSLSHTQTHTLSLLPQLHAHATIIRTEVKWGFCWRDRK